MKVLNDWINEEKTSGRKVFKEKPFNHVFITDFLIESRTKTLFNALKNERFEKKDSDLFSFSQTKDLIYSTNKVIKSFIGMLNSEDFTCFAKKLIGINVKRRAIDVSGSLYKSTGYLLCHDDRLENRKIAFVFYFSDMQKKDGGAFCLFNTDNKGKPKEIVKRYFPKWNGFLIFKVSGKSFHSVEEVLSNKKRYAIGGWLR